MRFKRRAKLGHHAMQRLREMGRPIRAPHHTKTNSFRRYHERDDTVINYGGTSVYGGNSPIQIMDRSGCWEPPMGPRGTSGQNQDSVKSGDCEPEQQLVSDSRQIERELEASLHLYEIAGICYVGFGGTFNNATVKARVRSAPDNFSLFDYGGIPGATAEYGKALGYFEKLTILTETDRFALIRSQSLVKVISSKLAGEPVQPTQTRPAPTRTRDSSLW